MRDDRIYTIIQDQNSDCNTAMTWAPEGNRRRGRPKTTWRCTVEKERKKAGQESWDEVRTITANREKWKVSVKALLMCQESRRGQAGEVPQVDL